MSESAQSKEERRLAAECKGNKNSFKKEKKKKGKKSRDGRGLFSRQNYFLGKHIISQVRAAKCFFSAATIQQPKPFQSYAT